MKNQKQSVLLVLSPGLGASLQDRRRLGWRRWGIPASGPMDSHSALCANRLLDNPTNCAAVELLLHGAKFQVLQETWVALCGAEITSSVPPWRAYLAKPGEIISVDTCRSGMWSYLAVEGGFASELMFGSASFYARGGIGSCIIKQTVLDREIASRFQLPRGVSGRSASWADRLAFAPPQPIRVYPGPQWKSLSNADRELFLKTSWKVSPRSDRVGYRLEGPALKPAPSEIISEPVRLGSIQVPENGQPIVTMPDGPTVGGYPKIALVHSDDLRWVSQCRPGESLRFQLTP